MEYVENRQSAYSSQQEEVRETIHATNKMEQVMVIKDEMDMKIINKNETMKIVIIKDQKEVMLTYKTELVSILRIIKLYVIYMTSDR